VIQRAEGTLWRRLLDGVLVLAPDAHEPFVLQPPADLIWQLLDEPIDPDDLDALLLEQFADADPVRLLDDVHRFIDDLVASGAVVRR
jgi:hypothetical protein